MSDTAVESLRSPVLSIVIVNSDGIEDTLVCLDSIFNFPPSCAFEVILVDNRSVDSPLPTVRQRYPELKILRAPERQGFAENYNLGMRQAQGDFIVILNNDTIVHPRALDILVEKIGTQADYGMAGPKLLSANGDIQTACARELLTPTSYMLTQLLLDLGTPTGKLWDRHQQRRLERRRSGPVPCISGACMLVKREVLDKAGLLDEAYDFYYEDVEWCHRLKKLGYQVAYVAEAEITHLGDRSLSKVKEWAKQSEYLSAVRYFRQYYGLSAASLGLLWLATVLSYTLRAGVYWAIEKISGKPSYATSYRRLASWIIRQSPAH